MKLYNSLTRKKEEFEPLKRKGVGMYVCGPTVYDEPHIGHARSAYVFDVIKRYLEYKGFKVMLVRNITDIDDKIIEKARKETKAASGREASNVAGRVTEVAKRYLAAYHEAMKLLHIDRPDKEPKATEYVPKMVKFIELLIKRERAYETAGDVYFDITTAEGYGKLSNQNLARMEAGARISPVENKKNPLDFALWKKAKEDEPSWESPWGRGRPGWHIECSVMSSDMLGSEFDIHGGGIDLIFPHHENEIAQSEGAVRRFARYWLHNGLLTINGEKMAKSLGNFISIKDFLARYRDPDYLKFLFLSTHYRHPVDYSDAKIGEMKKEKERFLILIGEIDRILKAGSKGRSSSEGKAGEIEPFRRKFEEAMDDDFNTPLALAALFDLATYANKFLHGEGATDQDTARKAAAVKSLLLEAGGVLGLDLAQAASQEEMDVKKVKRLIKERDEARERRDFKAADRIRQELSAKGIILEDTKEGTIWRERV